MAVRVGESRDAILLNTFVEDRAAPSAVARPPARFVTCADT